MATKTARFEFPEDAWDGIVNAFCHQYGYQTEINGEPNPQTPEDFTSAKVLDFISDIFRAYVVASGVEQARQQAEAYAVNRIAEVKQATTITVE